MITATVVMNDGMPYKAFMFVDDAWEVIASSNDPDILRDFMNGYCSQNEYFEIVGW